MQCLYVGLLACQHFCSTQPNPAQPQAKYCGTGGDMGGTGGDKGVTGRYWDDITGFMYIQVIRQAGGHLSRFAEFFLFFLDCILAVSLLYHGYILTVSCLYLGFLSGNAAGYVNQPGHQQ